MAWFDWFQSDLPCEFSSERTRENRDYLEQVLGLAFIERIDSRRTKHPVLNYWDAAGAPAFIQLNALAEDLRLLEGKRGFSEMIRDLREDSLCLPTWHLTHTAALFERARTGAVVELIHADQDDAPDLIVTLDGDHVPVEAKLLMQSEQEARFNVWARELIAKILDEAALHATHIACTIVVKSPELRPPLDVAKSAVAELLQSFSGVSICSRGEGLNVFVEPATFGFGISDYRMFCVLAPVPDSENLRVLSRAKEASRQLRTLPSIRSGILCVGLAGAQDGGGVFANLSRRMRAGYLRGISAVILLKRSVHLASPKRTCIDLLEVRNNPSAEKPIRQKVPLRPLGAGLLLTPSELPVNGIRAYRFASTTGTVTDPSSFDLQLPDISYLSPELIQ